MIRPAKTAQDGWSTNENIIYRVMWAKGQETEPEVRKTRIGTATLMAESGLRETATRTGVKGLKAKKDVILTVPPSDPVTPATYLIYSFRRVIERRADSDLLYAERPMNSREVKLITTAEAQARQAKGEPVKLRPEHSPGSMVLQAMPAGKVARSAPPAAAIDPAKRPAMSRVKQVARSDAIAFKPEDWSAIRAELDGIEPDNMTAEADLRKADLAENPDAQIRETVYKVRGLARQVRAANQRRLGSIHSPVAWMLARIGAMIVDMEAEAQREAAARSAEQTAAAVKVKAEAVKKEAVKVSPAAVEKGREAWKAILGYLETQVIRQSFETWLKPTKGGWIKGKILTVRVPSEEFNHIGEKYSDFIQAAIESLKLNVQDVTFITEG